MEKIDLANQEALGRMLSAEPVLIDVVPAAEVILDLSERTIFHAGPPIEWDRMCGPLQGAITGVSLFEGWAKDLRDAETMAQNGDLTFDANHHHDTVGPMTGVTTLSQPVFVVENKTFGNRAYCTINEGLGKVMRFGGNDDEVLDRLRWIRDELGPLLGAAIRNIGGISLKPLIARGLTMGDEMHQRNVACSSLILREISPSMVEICRKNNALAKALKFIATNDQFHLNICMAMAKSMMDPVAGIEYSTIVTAMTRNGTDFGIRVSGTTDKWFIAPVGNPEGLYFAGYSELDANPDMGDSTIIETIGLGGFAMGASPAVAGFVGAGTGSNAAKYTRDMGEITIGENPEWTIPALDYLGVPTGIDIRSVLDTGIMPVINTGIAHRKPGIGQVGAGIVRAPQYCFIQALKRLAEILGI